MSKRILGIDVDGVLANFNHGLREVLSDLFSRSIPADGDNPPVWDWPQHYGFTNAETGQAWAEIQQSPYFWERLGRLEHADDFIDAIQSSPDDNIYFLTSRPGLNAKLQTEVWLELTGMTNPTVLITLSSADKGALATGLGLTHFIDDKGSNCKAVKLACPQTHVFLLDRNYNRAEQGDLQQLGVVVISSIMEFVEALRAEHD